MKTILKLTVKFILIIILYLGMPFSAQCQVDDEGADPGGNVSYSPDEVAVPIDDGLILLLGVGIAYFIKLDYDRRKQAKAV